MVLSKFLFFHFLGNQTMNEKELRNDFAWVWGWGLWNLWFFFLMVFLCWIFWVYEFGFWVYEFYLLEVSLLIERWENLGLSWDFVYLGFVVWENLRRSAARFVFVFLLEIDSCLCLVDKKGQENARKSGHVLLCLKSGFVFFGVLVEDEPRSGQLIFFLLLKLKNKYFKL